MLELPAETDVSSVSFSLPRLTGLFSVPEQSVLGTSGDWSTVLWRIWCAGSST